MNAKGRGEGHAPFVCLRSVFSGSKSFDSTRAGSPGLRGLYLEIGFDDLKALSIGLPAEVSFTATMIANLLRSQYERFCRSTLG